MAENLMIRAAQERDAEAIYLLNKDGFGYDYAVAKTKERLKAILKEPQEQIFVAETDGNVVGYVHISDYTCTYTEPLKDIRALVVAQGYRGRGIGRALLSTAENWAKQQGAAGTRLISGAEREEAHHFYLGCGYTHRKSHKNFIKIFKKE